MRLLKTIKIIAAVAVAVMSSSCADREAGRIMDTADAMMWTMPDSALTVMESIDTLDLKTKVQRARYSLLYTMALDRNHLSIKNIDFIRPAATYYERHGSYDDKMKMYFYLGTAQYDNGDLESAIASYLRAKEYSSKTENLVFKGIISSSISDVYLSNNNSQESISYCSEACDYFSQAKDSFRLWNTTGALAVLYSNINDWVRADSLFDIFFSQPVRDSAIYSRQLLNLAWNNIFKPGSDPLVSIDLFNKSTLEYGGEPLLNDYCVYAYASEIMNEHGIADAIVHQLEKMDSSSAVLKIWRYRIAKHREDYKNALSLLEQSIDDQSSEISKTIGQSVALAQSDYYENKSMLLENDRKIQRQRKCIILLIGVIVMSSAIGIYLRRRKQWQSRLDEMSYINAEVNKRLNELLLCESEHLHSIDSLTSANQQAEAQIRSLSEKLLNSAGNAQVLMEMRTKYVQANRQMYTKLNDLCRRYLESTESSKDGKDRIYAEVKRILAILDESNQKGLESMLDENLDGVMTKLRADLPDTPERDLRFISFLILGFDAKTIARMMGYNVNTVYTKRYNIKEKIMKSDSGNKTFFLELIS